MPGDSSDSPPDIDVAQDLAFERRSWVLQRIAWIVGLLLLIAALAGAFGHGPLSSASAASTDGMLQLDYQRVLRNQAPAALRLRVTPDVDGQAVVWLGQEYLHKARVRQITPEPERAEVCPDRVVYTFRAAGSSEVELHFRFDIEGMGLLPLRLGLGMDDNRAEPARQTLSVSQFILP